MVNSNTTLGEIQNECISNYENCLVCKVSEFCKHNIFGCPDEWELSKKETAPSAGDTENSGYKNTYGKSIDSEFQNVNTLIGIKTDGSLIIKQLKPTTNGGAGK
jgi:hypothetical protein